MWGPHFILIYNDSYRPFPGPRHPAALGKNAKDVYGESWPVVGPLLENALATGETLFYEKMLVPLPAEGGTRDAYLNYSFNPIYQDGRIAGLFGSLHDVTGEVLASRQLVESETRLSRILQSIGDAVIVTDMEARVVRMNPVAEALTGWSAEEAAGRLLGEVFHIIEEGSRREAESPAAKVMRLGTVAGLANHTLLVRRDGSETPIDDSGAPIRDEAGELTGIVLVFRDVTERRAAERERDAVTKELNQVLEATTDGVLSVNRSWRMTFVNHCAQAMLAPSGELQGRNFWEMFPRTIYEGSPFVEHYHRAMDERVAGAFEAFYPEPLNAWFTVLAQPSDDGIIIFFRDVTQQRQSEAALLQSEKLAAVGRLASSIAHEINNPLEAVMNLIYLARQHAKVKEAQEFLDKADQEIRRVAIIANQTLRFHKQPSNPQAIGGEALFATVLDIYEGRLKNANVEVERRFRTKEQVVCFEGDIRQVLNNLVSNALDAMPAGGRLLIRSRAGTHRPTGRRGLVLTIADTGEGIRPELLKNIFDAFFTTKGIGGTGLGLWVSQEIVSRHHGVLRVRSTRRPGRSGTVFVLFLPFGGEGL